MNAKSVVNIKKLIMKILTLSFEEFYLSIEISSALIFHSVFGDLDLIRMSTNHMKHD